MPMKESAITAFISYKYGTEAENLWVEKLACDLRGCGIDALLDKWEVRAGESFIDYMASKVAVADIFLFVITDRSTKAAMKGLGGGGAISFELQVAVSRRISDKTFRVIGLFRSGKKPPAHIDGQRWVDFRDDESYATSLSLLVDDLLGSSAKPPLGGRRYRALLSDLARAEEKIKEIDGSIQELLSTKEGRERGLDHIDNYSRMLDEEREYRDTLLKQLAAERSHGEA